MKTYGIVVKGDDDSGWTASVVSYDPNLTAQSPPREFEAESLSELMDARVLGYMLGY
jgi:hypothetical protein